MVRNRKAWFGGAAAAAIAVVLGVAIAVGGGGIGQAAAGSTASGSAASGSTMELSALAAPAGARTISGISTHYVLAGLPNCSYPKAPTNRLFVAMSPSEYHGASACGGYLRVTGPHGSVTVEVIDQCPECGAGHIDLSEPAFAKLAPLKAGLIKVHYRHLVNPPLPGPIAVEVKSGSSRWWLALLVENTGNPLKSVQVRTGGGRWQNLSRANYNYWIAQSGAGAGRFTVRLIDTAGHTVTVGNIALRPGVVQSTKTYMYGH